MILWHSKNNHAIKTKSLVKSIVVLFPDLEEVLFLRIARRDDVEWAGKKED